MKKNILVTGASGFIGQELCKALSDSHNVIALSRRGISVDGVLSIEGDFAKEEDLYFLEEQPVDLLIHLAAVTGGCSERDGVLVNVEGTRTLMSKLLSVGCRKMILASSIAVVGIQGPLFTPEAFPIRDDHPCWDKYGYGFSKHLMEEVSHYYCRQVPDLDIHNLRLASIFPDENPPSKSRPEAAPSWALGSLTLLSCSDVVHAFSLAVGREALSGVKTYNVVNQEAWTDMPTAQVLRNWLGDSVDLSYYEQPGNEYASAFDCKKAEVELGFSTITVT